MSLIEKAEAAVDQEAAQEMSKKLKKMDFDFNDYLTSLEQMNKMGGISSILNMLPGMGSKMKDVESMIDEKAMDRTKSIILSMTPQERSNPGILNVSPQEPHCKRRRCGCCRSQSPCEAVRAEQEDDEADAGHDERQNGW